ncbi:hypothetical protein, partial [Pleomorphochaeta sp. DL1XJH-081]|uniref:hypothetical protein n=1 Tax=Pleomorphochaeta sp. DL1XJH-081 TaxID=3409690 RepID=UPI003BB659B2
MKKMGAKLIVLLGLLAMTLVVCSEVAAARELAETTNAVDPSKESVMDELPPAYGKPVGGTPGGGGCSGCSKDGQKMDAG